jgi:hypothetical protein
MPDLAQQLKMQAERNAENDRQEREYRIENGIPFADSFDIAVEMAERDKRMALERAASDAAEAERKRVEDDKEIALAQQAERHQAHYDQLYQQMQQLIWATKLQNPRIPTGPAVQKVLVDELESMRVPEVSMGSIMAAYENLFDRGVLVPDYSKGARANAIELAEKARRNGLQIPVEYEKPPEEMTPEEAMAMQRRLQPVSVAQLKALTGKLQDYAEYKQRKKSPAGKGTRRASGL